MSDYQTVRSAAAELPVADRLRLIDDLAASVSDDHLPSLSGEWLAEIERRSAEIDSGDVTTESWQEVRQRLLHRVGLDAKP